MRKLLYTAVFALTILGGSAVAEAGLVIEGSVGKGYKVDSPRAWQPTNIMVAPGYHFLGILRAQLGLVGDLGDVQNSKFDLQLRPMIGVYPPILPIYARAILAFQNLLNDTKVAFGVAGGLKIELPIIGLGIFAEAGFLPRFSPTQTIVEGRLGGYWAF
jgi:hypothetical protein